MVTYSVIIGAAFWFMVKNLTGLLQSLGYVCGMLWASWVFEYVRSDCGDDDK
ncbi:MAG TPA: hypothetical protein VGA09_00565 [Candidatus Binatia bacterium]|jgi:uncharacterized membrane protein YqaE (UPF0057 family)